MHSNFTLRVGNSENLGTFSEIQLSVLFGNDIIMYVNACNHLVHEKYY